MTQLFNSPKWFLSIDWSIQLYLLYFSTLAMLPVTFSVCLAITCIFNDQGCLLCHIKVWFFIIVGEWAAGGVHHRCVSLVSPPSLLPLIHTLKGNFTIFQNKILLWGWSNSAAHNVGLPLRLHLHILPESSNTNEFISYFRELSRSTLPFPPCQPQVWPKRGIQIELKSPVIQ